MFVLTKLSTVWSLEWVFSRQFSSAVVPEVNELVVLEDAVVVRVVVLHQRLDLAVRELEVSQDVSRFLKRDLVVSVSVHPLEDVLQLEFSLNEKQEYEIRN